MKKGDVIIVSNVSGTRVTTFCPNAFALTTKESRQYINSVWRVKELR